MKQFLLFACMTLTILATAQTNPTAQVLPFSENFGTSGFTSMPAGMASWNGLSGVSIKTQALAETSVSSGDATIVARTSTTNTGGSYSYTASSNTRVYIQSSSNATNGVNQIVAAINTGAATAVTISYNIEVIDNGTGRTLGSVLQYRSGTSGSWTTVASSGVEYNNSSSNKGDADDNGDIDSYNFSVLGLNANTDYQFRWAHWRSGSSGNSVGIAYDNIVIQSTGAGSLPVKFSSLDATTIDNSVSLKWLVATEENLKGYEVERSSDGRSFSKIGFVKATGQGIYSFLDINPFYSCYYRIKSIDIDGKYGFSAVAMVKSRKTMIMLKAFPTPFIKNVSIQHPTANSRSLITIFSQDGRTVKAIVPSIGTQQTDVDLSSGKAGLYIIRYNNGKGEVETLNILKQ